MGANLSSDGVGETKKEIGGKNREMAKGTLEMMEIFNFRASF